MTDSLNKPVIIPLRTMSKSVLAGYMTGSMKACPHPDPDYQRDMREDR